MASTFTTGPKTAPSISPRAHDRVHLGVWWTFHRGGPLGWNQRLGVTMERRSSTSNAGCIVLSIKFVMAERRMWRRPLPLFADHWGQFSFICAEPTLLSLLWFQPRNGDAETLVLPTWAPVASPNPRGVVHLCWKRSTSFFLRIWVSQGGQGERSE